MSDLDTPAWHGAAISGVTRGTLEALRDASLLEPFYLAGGTGLALHFGHRLSQDLDFFHRELFDEEVLLQRIQRLPRVALLSRAPHTLHADIGGTKVSFLGYAYPLLFPLARFLDVQVASPAEIACMKVSAIASRGTKRDFVDLYAAAQRFRLAEILKWFDQKYVRTGYNRLHVLKSLSFFEDAEKDPMPHMLAPLAWDDVRKFFLREVPGLV